LWDALCSLDEVIDARTLAGKVRMGGAIVRGSSAGFWIS
jgi:hypothetical protein